jgi:carbon-monoxide dehydrogenase medium subunit
MKPAAFEYERPGDLDLAVKALARAGSEARLLAGGQTLGPMLNMRLAMPARLIDLGSIASLKRIETQGDTLTIGAGVTHAMLEDRQDSSPTGRLLSHVASTIAFRAIRTRGTIGGSLAHADPAADWVTITMLLDARITLVGPNGTRRVAAGEFFKGTFSTQIRPEEILESISIAKLSADSRWGYYKICRKVGEFPEAIGAVIFDPVREIARIVVGALDGPPALLSALAMAVARDGLPAANLDAIRNAVNVAAPGLDEVDRQIHSVAVRRAIIQGVAQ